MRNVVIFDNSGESFPCTFMGKCSPKNKKFTNGVFSLKGNIICIPFLESLIKFFENLYPDNEEGIEKLKKLEDNYKIHLMYNSLLYNKNGEVDEKLSYQPWKKNVFLSNIYGREIYAENVCVFIAESEINGYNEVDIDEYSNFINTIMEIMKTNSSALIYDYFKTLSYFINNESFIEITDRKELMDIKKLYDSGEYTLFTDCVFLEKEDNNPLLLRKNGAMMYVNEEDECEFYFDCVRNNISNPTGYVEKIC